MSLGWVGPRRREESSWIDSGLQSERTSMAWQRTGLALGAVSALLLHKAGGDVVSAIPGLIGMMISIFVLIVSEVRYERTVRRVIAGETPARPAMLRLVAFTATALSIAALVLVVTRYG